MDAVREVGNSLRWIRVSWRWEGVAVGVGVISGLEASGVREMDQASPLRKRTFEDEDTGVFCGLDMTTELVTDWVEICFPDSKVDGRFASSHWVSQP